MGVKAVTYGLLLVAFIFGSIYHFKIRKECIYLVKLTKVRIVISIIIPLIFCIIAYIGGDQWHYYILSLAAAVFLISGIVGEGIHEKGIYYRGSGSVTLLILLAKWDDIKDIKIDINNSKLESFRYKAAKIYLGQHYNRGDIIEIKKIVEDNIPLK